MNTSEWYDLKKGWAMGSDDCPVAEEVRKICDRGIKIKKECKLVSSKLVTIDMDYIQEMTEYLMEIDDKLIEMIAIFEGLCIRCYNPTEKDLETETIIKKKPEKVEEPEETEAEPQELYKAVSNMKSEFKPEDIEIKELAEDIIVQKKNVLAEFKNSIKILKNRTDIGAIYKDKPTINFAQVMNYLHEILSTIGNIKSTLMFAKKYYNNYCGIRISVLYFMSLVPEKIVRGREKGKL